MSKVSLIVPLYNMEKTLSRCIESILQQTYKNLELLLIDDGSTDRTYEICCQAAKKDERVRVYHNENHGVSFTRNFGIVHASGQYLMFVDGDDVIAPTWVQSYHDAIIRGTADVVLGGLSQTFSDGKIISLVPPDTFAGELWHRAIKDPVITALIGYVPNKIYNSEFLKREGLSFNERITVQEDLDFFLRVCEVTNCIPVINECGYFYEYSESIKQAEYYILFKNRIRMMQVIQNYTELSDEQIVLSKIQFQKWMFSFTRQICLQKISWDKVEQVNLLIDKTGEQFSGIVGVSESSFIYALARKRKYSYVSLYHSLKEILFGKT